MRQQSSFYGSRATAKTLLWRSVIVFVGSALLVNAAGCSAVATALWATGQLDAKPEFAGLKDKKVAIVARPVVSLSYRDAHVDKELARRVHTILVQRVPKAQWIDPQKVEAWIDEHDWEQFTDVGKGVGADLVIGIEIEEFSLYKGQTVYQGTATVNVLVFDCATGQQLFEKRLTGVNFPPNSVVPTSEMPEPDFRREFVSVLATSVARLFHSYDPHEFWALDAKTIR